MATAARAICDARGAIRNVTAAHAWVTSRPELALALRGKTLVYFNGAFSPPTRAHSHVVTAALQEDDVDLLWLDPEPGRPGKEHWLDETLLARVSMCELMAAEADHSGGRIGVGTLRHDLGPELGQSPELFRVLRVLVGETGRLIWAIGADVFEGMQYWREKALQCLQPGDTCDGLFVFTRSNWTEERLQTAVHGVGNLTCDVRVLPIPSTSLDFSSTAARQQLTDKSPSCGHEGIEALHPTIVRFCRDRPELCRIYRDQVAATRCKSECRTSVQVHSDAKRARNEALLEPCS